MNKKRILIATGGALVIVTMSSIVGLVGLNTVSALTTGTGFSTIVNNIAAKFNLKAADVEQVFQDTKTTQEKARLDTLVTNGTITAAQETLIINKRAEIQTQIEALNNKQLTVTERQTEMEKIRTDVTKWATDNKISVQYVLGGRGMGRGGMMGQDGAEGLGGGMMDGGLDNGMMGGR